MARLSGKRAVVTAAGQGIGRAAALAMHNEGAHVIASDINLRNLDELADLGLETRYLNVRDSAEISAFAHEQGAVDILFNCAGYEAVGTILDGSDLDWAFSLDLNLSATLRMCRAFMPAMIAQGGGVIINMASAMAISDEPLQRAFFTASKAGVIGLTKSIAADFAQQNIRCNAICPTQVASPSWVERMQQENASHKPVAQPEDIAPLVIYLASDESRFVSGSVQRLG